MLVLALQFSRGGGDASRSSAELDASGVQEAVLRLLQNGREDRSAGGPDERGKPTTSLDSTTNPPVHQLGVQSPDDLWSPTVWNGLLRKEVIQPHLPVRLPCYDFTPITDPTFDGSPPKGLGHRLRVLPTFVV
jgi:hypothetical protein